MRQILKKNHRMPPKILIFNRSFSLSIKRAGWPRRIAQTFKIKAGVLIANSLRRTSNSRKKNMIVNMTTTATNFCDVLRTSLTKTILFIRISKEICRLRRPEKDVTATPHKFNNRCLQTVRDSVLEAFLKTISRKTTTPRQIWSTLMLKQLAHPKWT